MFLLSSLQFLVLATLAAMLTAAIICAARCAERSKKQCAPASDESLASDIESWLAHLRIKPIADASARAQAWSHICEASSAVKSYFFWKPREDGKNIWPGCLQSARRNYILARHYSGHSSQEGAMLLALREQAAERRFALAKLQPSRPFTTEEMTGHLDMVSRPPRCYRVNGDLNSLESDCDYEGMMAYIDRERARHQI